MSDIVDLAAVRKKRAGEAFEPVTVTFAAEYCTFPLFDMGQETKEKPVRETWLSRVLSIGFSKEKAVGLFLLTRKTTLSSIVDECAETLGHDATVTLLEEQIGRVILSKLKKGD